jgi:hypothetical protein
LTSSLLMGSSARKHRDQLRPINQRNNAIGRLLRHQADAPPRRLAPTLGD